MERRGYVRPIQGGGDGIGFQTPRQILQIEPQRATRISRKMLVRAGALSSAGANVGGEVKENQNSESQKQLIWRRELEYRLFLLKKRQAEQNMILVGSIARPTRAGSFQPSNSDSFNTADTISYEMNTVPAVSTALPSRNSMKTFRSQDGSNLGSYGRHILVKYVPGLPKTTEMAIEFWRRGSERNGYKPVRLFETVEMRRLLIPNYENKYWAKSGQKHLFYKFKAIAELVSEFGSVLIRLDCEGQDGQWNEALQGYHDHFDPNGKAIALTTALKQAKDF